VTHLRIALLAVGLVLTVIVCKRANTRSNSAGDPAAAGKAVPSHEVVMRDYSFTPESLNVSVGDKVTWVNQGQAAHTTTSGLDGKPDGRWIQARWTQGPRTPMSSANRGTFTTTARRTRPWA